jgi:hypothetical protein
MTCPDCRDRLQQWLDGRPNQAASVPGQPALCPACAEWAAAGRRLDQGLRLLPRLTPPPRLADRIVAQVAAERRFRRYRVLLVAGAAAVAAALLFAVWQGLGGRAPTPAPVPGPIVQAPEPSPTPTSLRDSMAEASSAVASLTTRTADETVGKTKILLPVVDSSLSKLDLPPSLDRSTGSLRQTGEGVSAGLEPVADSARRAVGLFLRELPPMDAAPKTGF